ncbi:LytR C-terminal domain-containing protein [Patescibacteria group bacterium]|nr:LytR C-terminal domain-containing protein [Patescibacteria group bacterium]
MILNFPNLRLRRNVVSVVAALVLLCAPAILHAQTAQLLSVSPTLFEMSAEPGQTWTSALKVVNPNAYDLTVYVSVVNFSPRGEGGEGTLLPVLESESEGVTLAEWVTVDSSPVTIAKEGVATVPFTVSVPEAAAPGGHFAALLVSTRPPAESPGATQLRTAQVVTSLFFLRVAGDVAETGTIREFNTVQSFYGSPRADFALRFENTGNVHLRPQGDITISNMWGQERGIIPINRQNHFGNVLPESIRKFSFTWEGEWSLSDIGRHKAIVTLAYGQDARQFVTSTTYFWFVPLVPVAVTLTSLILLIGLVVWLVRLYVRRLLNGAGFSTHARRPYVQPVRRNGDLALTRTSRETIRADGDEPAVPSTPRESIAVIARDRVVRFVRYTYGLIAAVCAHSKQIPIRTQLQAYWKPLLAATVVLVLIAAVVMFVRSALTPQRSYNIIYEDETGGQTVSSDEIILETQRDNQPVSPTISGSAGESEVKIDIVNVSGVAGAAATVALVLETQGYTIGEVTTDLSDIQGRTVIVYEGDTGDIALALSQQLNNALLSAYNDGGRSGAPVTIYIGTDIAVRE